MGPGLSPARARPEARVFWKARSPTFGEGPKPGQARSPTFWKMAESCPRTESSKPGLRPGLTFQGMTHLYK